MIILSNMIKFYSENVFIIHYLKIELMIVVLV